MKDHALNTIKEASFQTVYSEEEITWVITVPAIWNAAAKQFMRLAAKEVKEGLPHFLKLPLKVSLSNWATGTPQNLNNNYFKFQSLGREIFHIEGGKGEYVTKWQYNSSALSPHQVEMSPTETSGARTTTPAWTAGVKTVSLAGDDHAAVISPLSLTWLLSFVILGRNYLWHAL